MSPGVRIDAAFDALTRTYALLMVMIIKRRAQRDDLDEAIRKTEEALGHLRTVKEMHDGKAAGDIPRRM